MANVPTWDTEPQTVVETLERVRELLSDPKRWTRRHYARDTRGAPANPEDDDAAKFCLLGALSRVDGEFERTAERVLRYLLELGRPRLGNIPAFNDSSKVKHADVLALLDRAIEREKKHAGRSYDQGVTREYAG